MDKALSSGGGSPRYAIHPCESVFIRVNRCSSVVKTNPDSMAEGSRPIQCAEDGFDGGQFDIGVHARAPAVLAGAVLNLDIGDRGSLFAGAQGMFAVGGDFELWQTGGDETVDEGREGAVPLSA